MLLRKTWSVGCHVSSPANVGYVRGCLERGSIPMKSCTMQFSQVLTSALAELFRLRRIREGIRDLRMRRPL
jgi:hypothetical protein